MWAVPCTQVVTSTACLAGFIVYPLLQLARRRGWCEFNTLHFECMGVHGPATPVPDHRTTATAEGMFGLGLGRGSMDALVLRGPASTRASVDRLAPPVSPCDAEPPLAFPPPSPTSSSAMAADNSNNNTHTVVDGAAPDKCDNL